jgi:creatinine amidohydrolase
MRRWVLIVSVFAGTVAAGQTPPPAPRGLVLEDLTWLEAERALGSETVVVIPLGAAAVEHGPHLKLRSDLTLAAHLARRLVAVADLVVAPAVTYHYYPSFAEYPGSTTLAETTARDVVVQICRSLARYGPRRFYVLNTGISTVPALRQAAAQLAREGVLLRFTDVDAALAGVRRQIAEQEGGAHADEIETSMLLVVDPAAVDMSRAVKDYDARGRGALTRRPTPDGTYSPTGTWGDPTLATREKGERLIEAWTQAALAQIEDLRRTPVPPAASAAAVPRPPARAGRRATSRSPASGCEAADERALRLIGIAYQTAWTNADADRLAGLWIEDGDMAHPDGTVERSRRIIAQNRAWLFSQREYLGSRHPMQVGVIRCVRPDTAVVDGKWELRDVTDGRGGRLPPLDGPFTFVAAREEGGGWRIAAYRYWVTPASGPPTLLKRPGGG